MLIDFEIINDYILLLYKTERYLATNDYEYNNITITKRNETRIYRKRNTQLKITSVTI